MNNSAKESLKKDSASSYKFTQMFKLQKEILQGLARLVKDLKLLERDTWNILRITEPYLDCLQHSQLQVCFISKRKMNPYY